MFPHLLRAIASPPYRSYFLTDQTCTLPELGRQFINEDSSAVVLCIPYYKCDLCLCAAYT